MITFISIMNYKRDQNIELLFEYIDRLQEKQGTSPIAAKAKRVMGFRIGDN